MNSTVPAPTYPTARAASQAALPIAARCCGIDARRGCFFNHLLMATPGRTVALIEVDGVSGLVGEHLDLDVARLKQIFFDEHAVVTERGPRFALAGSKRRGELVRVPLTTRMPLPPPPAEALISTDSLCDRLHAVVDAGSWSAP